MHVCILPAHHGTGFDIGVMNDDGEVIEREFALDRDTAEAYAKRLAGRHNCEWSHAEPQQTK